MFASTFGADNIADANTFSDPQTWVLLVVGFGIALAMHLLKMGTRPVINTGTVGVGAPVASTAENVVAASLTGAALFAPVLVLILLLILVAPGIWLYLKWRGRRQRVTY